VFYNKTEMRVYMHGWNGVRTKCKIIQYSVCRVNTPQYNSVTV